MAGEINYREAIVGGALELVGAPSIKYVHGSPELGLSPADGFDCSGFVIHVLTQAGLHIPDFIGQDGVTRKTRHVNELWEKYGYHLDDELRDGGDLIFFCRGGSRASHMGIVVDLESYVQAPGKDGRQVKISPIEFKPVEFDGKQKRLYTKNPIGFKSPAKVTAEPTYRYDQDPI